MFDQNEEKRNKMKVNGKKRSIFRTSHRGINDLNRPPKGARKKSRKST